MSWIKPSYKTKSGYVRVSGSSIVKSATLYIYNNGTFLVERLGEMHMAQLQNGSMDVYDIIGKNYSDYYQFFVTE